MLAPLEKNNEKLVLVFDKYGMKFNSDERAHNLISAISNWKLGTPSNYLF